MKKNSYFPEQNNQRNGSEYEAVPVGPATCIMNLRHAMRDIDREAAKLGDDPSLHLKRSRPPIGRIEQRI